MVNLLSIISVLLLLISIVGLIYCINKKMNKGVWIILFVLSLLLTFFMFIARNDYKETVDVNAKLEYDFK